VSFGADDRPDDFDSASFADEERTADDAHELAAHEQFLLPSAEGGDGFVIEVAEQGEIEFVLGLEGGKGFHWVCAHAEDGDFTSVELLFCVTELGRLNGSTGGVGFGVEEKKNALTLEVLQGDGSAVVGREAKGGGFIAGFEHGNSFESDVRTCKEI